MLLYEMISSAFPFIQPDSLLLFLRPAWIGLTPCFMDSITVFSYDVVNVFSLREFTRQVYHHDNGGGGGGGGGGVCVCV